MIFDMPNEPNEPKVSDETAAPENAESAENAEGELGDDDLDAVAGGVAVNRPIARPGPEPVCITKLTQ